MTLTTRDELLFLLEELDRGARSRKNLEALVDQLNLLVSDEAALEILEDDELEHNEMADQLVGYPEKEV